MAYQFMKENMGQFSIREMAGLLGVRTGAYYKWKRNGVSTKRALADAELIRLIREIQENHHYRYGIPRVRAELRKKYGKRVSLKKVARIMRENRLNARLRRKFVRTTDSRHGLPVCENILNMAFQAEKPGEKWVSDITYLRTREGWLYLTTVLDLYDRKILGWALSADMETTHTVIPALAMVRRACKAPDRIYFSFRPGSSILLKIVSRPSSQFVSFSPSEHEPERQLLGQRLR
jgi:transposase InsO family protein